MEGTPEFDDELDAVSRQPLSLTDQAIDRLSLRRSTALRETDNRHLATRLSRGRAAAADSGPDRGLRRPAVGLGALGVDAGAAARCSGVNRWPRDFVLYPLSPTPCLPLPRHL